MTDPVIRYAIGRTVTSAEVDTFEAADFEEFCDTALMQGTRAAKKDGPYFCAAMRGGVRAKENAEPIALLALDFDTLRSEDELHRLMDAAQAWRGYGHTTASHDPAAGKFKVHIVFALDRPATAAEYPAVGRAVVAELARRAGVPIEADAACMKPEQPVYTMRKGAAKWRLDGALINVDKAARINGNGPHSANSTSGGKSEKGADGARIPAGKRNATLTAELARLRAILPYLGSAEDREHWLHVGMAYHDISDGGDDGFGLWCEWARQSPKFDLKDSRRVWESFGKRQGARLTAGSLYHIARGNGWRERRRLHDAAPHSTPQYVTAAELARMSFDPIRWVVRDLLPEGIYLLAARPKIGKSWLALQIGIACPRGAPVLGKATERGDVLYLALEDNARRLKRRLRKLGIDGDVPGLAFATEFPRITEGGLQELIDYARVHPALRLIIIDTLEKMRPLRSERGSVYADDYGAAQAFRQLVDEFKVTVLIVTHTRKALADDPIDSVSGSLGLTGSADGVLVIERARGETRAQLHVIGRDLEFEGAYAVEFGRESCTWSMLGEAHEIGRTEAREDLLRVLRQASEPLTLKAIAEDMGRKYDAVKKLAKRMVEHGEVVRDNRGYSIPAASAAMFPE